jgi:uncharacterized membrane protein YkvA (DUF1232 family)
MGKGETRSECSDKGLWAKVRHAAGTAGRFVLAKTLTLYYTLQDPDTPQWAKGVIVSALAYFILPLDAIPDFLPGGYADDLTVLAGALATVAAHVKEAHVRAARAAMRRLLGPDEDDLAPAREWPPRR